MQPDQPSIHETEYLVGEFSFPVSLGDVFYCGKLGVKTFFQTPTNNSTYNNGGGGKPILIMYHTFEQVCKEEISKEVINFIDIVDLLEITDIIEKSFFREILYFFFVGKNFANYRYLC